MEDGDVSQRDLGAAGCRADFWRVDARGVSEVYRLDGEGRGEAFDGTARKGGWIGASPQGTGVVGFTAGAFHRARWHDSSEKRQRQQLEQCVIQSTPGKKRRG